MAARTVRALTEDDRKILQVCSENESVTYQDVVVAVAWERTGGLDSTSMGRIARVGPMIDNLVGKGFLVGAGTRQAMKFFITDEGRAVLAAGVRRAPARGR